MKPKNKDDKKPKPKKPKKPLDQWSRELADAMVDSLNKQREELQREGMD